MKANKFPHGWDANRVRELLNRYETQTEDEAAFENQTQTVMEVPTELVPAVRELIAAHKG